MSTITLTDRDEWRRQANLAVESGKRNGGCCVLILGDDVLRILNTLDAAEARAEKAESLLSGPIAKVLLERERQKSVEGWTPEHDDLHSKGELSLFAIYYAMPEVVFLSRGVHIIPYLDKKYTCVMRDKSYVTPNDFFGKTRWNSEAAKYHSKTPERRLVVAMALLLAEAERIERATVREMVKESALKASLN